MAISPTRVTYSAKAGVSIWKWSDVTYNSECDPVFVTKAKELTVQANGGTWGDISVAWQGTIDPSGLGYVPMTDAQSGTALAQASADSISELLQIPVLVKPVLSGSSGSGLTLYLMIIC